MSHRSSVELALRTGAEILDIQIEALTACHKEPPIGLMAGLKRLFSGDDHVTAIKLLRDRRARYQQAIARLERGMEPEKSLVAEALKLMEKPDDCVDEHAKHTLDPRRDTMTASKTLDPTVPMQTPATASLDPQRDDDSHAEDQVVILELPQYGEKMGFPSPNPLQGWNLWSLTPNGERTSHTARTLFEPRLRPDNWYPDFPGGPRRPRSLNAIRLPVTGDRAKAATAAGARVGVGGALYAGLRDNLYALDAYLPFAARALIEPIQGDPIPETSFGASLASLLTPSCWAKIRSTVTTRCGSICEICGFEPGPREGIECHEMWEYHAPLAQHHHGVQKLTGFVGVCSACHLMFHPGFASIKGRFEETLARIATVNRYTAEEAGAYMEHVWELHEQRSQTWWSLDLSLVASESPLEIKPAKKDDDFILRDDLTLRRTKRWANGAVQTSETRLLGASFKVGRDGRVFHAEDPDPHYRLCKRGC